MFERVKRLFQATSVDDYIRRVAVALQREGLTPADLDQIQALPAFQDSDRIFSVLRDQRLSPEEAARALRLALNLFVKTRHIATATKQTWEAGPDQQSAEHENYFLKLLEEAARSVQFRA